MRRQFEEYWHRNPRAHVAVTLLCLGFIAAAGLMTVRRVEFEREAAIANEMKKNSNLAISIEEQTIRTFKAIDQVVLFVRHQYLEKGRKLDIRKLIAKGEIDDSSFTDIGIIDEHGFRILGRELLPRQSVNASDREFFQYHVQHGDRELHIGKPVLGRVTGKWAIHVTRRIEKPDGTFGGVAIISLDPSYFIRFYQQADLGSKGAVTLVGTDGVVRARFANLKGTFGDDMNGVRLFSEARRLPVGSFVGSGMVDGVSRILSYRTLESYPLIVVVGTSQDEALAPFYKQERDYYILVFALTSLLIAFFAVVWIGALSRQRRAMDSLVRSETQFRATYDQAAVGIARVSLDGQFMQVNPALCGMLGYSEEELLARAVADVTHVEDREVGTHDFRRKLFEGPNTTAQPETERRYLCKDGSIIWVVTTARLARDAAGEPDYFVSVIQDITKRKELQERLQYQANYDSLTQLPNRVLFYDRLAQALSHARRKSRVASVLYIDLDRFKAVNDTLGHEAGDDLLGQVTRRIKSRVRVEDTLARLGGDEFTLILSEVTKENDSAVVAQKIVDALALPFDLNGREVFVTSSIGIAMYPTDSDDAETLVKQADTAMLRAKASGRNNYQFYTSEMNERKFERVQLDADLRRALERDEFLLYFQPKMSLRSGEVVGTEALLRWRHPERGLVMPNDFIPVLEESGLIVPVGEWVLHSACKQIRSWQDAGVPPVPIAVNLSAKQFQHQDVARLVDNALRAYDVDPQYLEVEITESAAMQNADNTVVTLARLKGQGVTVAIDDFGTGYSSLNYLQRFPLDSLKLDRSFVIGLPGDLNGVSIALAVITMAHSLGLKVIAEGVETKEQLAFLAAHECDEVQGYYFARPLPSDECTEFMRKHRSGGQTNPNRAAGKKTPDLSSSS